MATYYKYFIIINIGLCLSCDLYAQDITIFDSFDDFEKEILSKKDKKIHVVNFWATWCAPCLKELPYLEELNNKLGDKGEVTLASLDFGDLLETRVKPIIKAKNLKSRVVILDDPDSNRWIDLIEKSWSGTIPATVFYKEGKRLFFEKEFHSLEELETIISKL